MDLKTQSDLEELKLEAGREHMWKTRPWPALQEKKFQRPAAIGFWENFCVMDASGHICSERALDARGKVLEQGPEYHRSSFLSSIPIHPPPKDRVTWVTEVQVHSGYLTFDQSSEDQVIRTCRTHGALFQARTLEKVNNDEEGDSFTPQEDFYPVLHNMLRDKQDWKHTPHFRGVATFELGTMEWTDSIMRRFGGILENAGILGAVGVSCFPYHYSTNTWKAFCELWGPLTNTLHHGNGEMGISLYDMRMIGGLPILGHPYEEFIPVNSELHCSERYPSTVAELLRIHSQLCVFYKRDFIYWDEWADYFYRGKLLYAAYGEVGNRKAYPHQGRFARRQPNLTISKEGDLAAFLAYWLSRFVLPSSHSNLRPDTFYMASLMAQGIKVSLAPSALGYIYHGLGLAATDPKGPGNSNVCFPIHYVIGWLGEHFPCLYRARADSDFPTNHPYLARYAGIEAVDLDISSARRVFRTDISVIYRPSSFIEQNGCFLTDDSGLSSDQFELLVCMRSSLLPVRVGRDLCLEPYYPNRFARQFGFDQGVPSNRLSFGLARRHQCCIEDLAKAQQVLLQTDTGARFYIPRSTYNGTCTWTYCRWWMRACAPYLGRSVSNVYLTLTKRRLEKRDDIFVIKSIREFSSNLRKEILFSEEDISRPTAYDKNSQPAKRTNRSGEYRKASSSNSEARHSKRHRNEQHEVKETTRAPFQKTLKCAQFERYDGYEDGRIDDTPFPQDDFVQDRDIAPHDVDKITIPRLKSVILRVTESNDSEVETRPKGLGQKSKRPLESEPEDLEPKSICSIPKACDVEVLVETPALGTNDSEPNPQQSEPRLKDSKIQAEDVHDSVSGATEPIDSNASEHIDEGVNSLTEATSTPHEIFGEGLNKLRMDFIIAEIQQILGKLNSPQSFGAILDCQDEISKTLDVLELMFKTLGSGKDRFEWFTAKVYLTFDLAAQLSQDMSIIEKDYGLDIERINELVQNHKKCQAAKKVLDSELLSLNQELASLKATERSIIEVEEKAQRLRKDYEIAKSHLEKKISWSEASLERQNKLDEELRQARIEAREDKLAEFKNVQSSFKVRQEALEKQIDTLKSFGQQLKQKL